MLLTLYKYVTYHKAKITSVLGITMNIGFFLHSYSPALIILLNSLGNMPAHIKVHTKWSESQFQHLHCNLYRTTK